MAEINLKQADRGSSASRLSPAGHSIVATAPCRVDLAGGTMDIWPLYLFHPGALTVNYAVNILTRCRITPLSGKQILLKSLDTGRADYFSNFSTLQRTQRYQHALAAHLVRHFEPRGGFILETSSGSPAGAGISGSSALMVATTAALARYTGRRVGREEIRVLAQNIEARLIGVPTGCQDYYPALYGGVNAVTLAADGIRRSAIAVDSTEIDKRFLLAYTGTQRQSGINNWEVFKAHLNGDRKVFRNFEQIGEIARQLRQALERADWNAVAELLRAEWKFRKTSTRGITTPLIDALVAASMKQGARAAKVCGAGGGGCVIFLIEPEARERLVGVIRSKRASIFDSSVARRGLIVRKAKA